MATVLSDDAQKFYEHYSKYIIGVAQSQDQNNAGAHYLWGANGGIPGDGKVPGHSGKSSNVKKIFPNILTQDEVGVDAIFFSCKTNVENYETKKTETFICLGRCADPIVKSKPFGDIFLPNAPAQPDKRWARSRDLLNKNPQLLNTYNAVVPETQRRPLNNDRLKIKQPGVNGMSWGEYCWDKQHFDCIGLIRWTISQVLDYDGYKLKRARK